jgi:hypothetical protein
MLNVIKGGFTIIDCKQIERKKSDLLILILFLLIRGARILVIPQIGTAHISLKLNI